MRGKGLVGSVSGPGGIGAHDPEMIRGACTQARNVRIDILVGVSSFAPVGRSGSITCRPSVLKVHGGAQSVGINRAFESG